MDFILNNKRLIDFTILFSAKFFEKLLNFQKLQYLKLDFTCSSKVQTESSGSWVLGLMTRP